MSTAGRPRLKRDGREGVRRRVSQERAQSREQVCDRGPEVRVRMGHRRAVYVRQETCRIGERKVFCSPMKNTHFYQT